MKKKYYIGIDGGGTYTKVVAVDESGIVVCDATGDTINFNAVPFAQAQHNLQRALAQIALRVPFKQVDSIFIGCSALDGEADDETTRKLLGEYAYLPSKMSSDLYIALLGHTLDKSGVLIVSGTGSMAIARDDTGRILTCGGWGYGIGDEGSAYDIAVKGISAAIRYYDGLDQPTQLYDGLLEFYHLSHIKELIPCIYQPQLNRQKIAGFAVVVSRCAQSGDLVAQGILCDAALVLSKMACTLLARTSISTNIAVYGGVFQNCLYVRQKFVEQLEKYDANIEVVAPELPPEIGAVIAAMMEKRVTISPHILHNLHLYCNGRFE